MGHELEKDSALLAICLLPFIQVLLVLWTRNGTPWKRIPRTLEISTSRRPRGEINDECGPLVTEEELLRAVRPLHLERG